MDSIKIELYSHVDSLREEDSKTLENLGRSVLGECLNNPSANGPVDLPNLSVVEISVVDDPTIAQVHADFLNDPSPTDVITFPHGEILISYDTAKALAEQEGHSVVEELLLYIIHGLLHLNGHLDHDPEHRKKMHAVQDQIWKRQLTQQP